MKKTRRNTEVSVQPLKAAHLRPVFSPNSLGFKSTDELNPINTLIGQDRALGAIRFGVEISQPGYNLFALGPQGTGRHTAILSYLNNKVKDEPAPNDWVYVHNFKSPHHPQAIRLPARIATVFRDAIHELIDDLQTAIPTLFQSDEYREKHRAIETEFEETQEEAFEELNQKAAEQDIGILRTPVGFALAPMHDGKVIKPEVFNVLPKEQREEIEGKIDELQSELSEALEQLPQLEKQLRDKIRELNAEVTGKIVDAAIKSTSKKFDGIDAIQKRLSDIRDDIVENVSLFLPANTPEETTQILPNPAAKSPDIRLNRYLVNIMVTNDSDGDNKGAPLVTEDHPILSNLVGRIEHVSQYGALVTDFTMIAPGALHRANGGYLIIDARKILSEPFSWEALKRALTSEKIAITSAAEQLSLVSTTSLDPEPIPLDVKVVLIGERILYYLLSTLDPDFTDLFKVQVDFDEELERTDENVALYSRLIATIAQKEKLLPFNAASVARILTETTRLAEDSERLSLKISRLADLLREADFWARDAKHKKITDQDVERAYSEQINRASRIRELSQEGIDRGIILIETEGEAIGQINGLSVLSIGNFSFGKPSRITTRVRMGAGKVIDIERETKLGGPLHSKGVLILSSYLAATFATDVPMSLWASIVFEQSYGGVDGDSASSAELYALMSSLADVPIQQSLAVTGSVNQNGQIQAIGGVNEKIEGYFDICNHRGLSGTQGVLIPSTNVKHLCLREDVVDACRKGQFHIYPVETIDQGIKILTGVSAGERNADGIFPKDTINARVETKLRRFAQVRKKFSSDNEKESKDV